MWDMTDVPALIPVLLFYSWVNDLHLDYEHVISNLVLETIDYLARKSYPTVPEHVIWFTWQDSNHQDFAMDYPVLLIYQQ
jgi:hypothetical protein